MPARCRFYGVGHGGQLGAGARVAAVLEIPLLRLVDNLPLPSYAREGAAGADLPLSRLHRELLSQGVEEGLGELDNSSIIEVLRNRPSPEEGGD